MESGNVQTQFGLLLPISLVMMTVETPSLMKTSPFSHYKIPKSRTTRIQTGTLSPLMRDLVSYITQFALVGTFNNFTKEFRTNKPSDVISTLVSIYDSKDLFVKELQILLAQRLLT